MTLLGGSGCCNKGLAINGLGQVVGTTSSNGGTTFQAAHFSAAGTTIIPNPGSLQNATAVGISNAGDVAVVSYQGNSATSFLDHNGVFTNIGSLGGPLATFATSMNGAGVITGFSGLGADVSDFRHGIVYQNGILTDLGNLGGASRNSIAYGANSAGAVTGSVDNAARSADVTFLYSHGLMTGFGPGCGQSSGFSINDLGAIVGAMFCGSGTSAMPRSWSCRAG